MEQRGQVQDGLEEDQLDEAHPEQNGHGQPEQGGKDQFAGMKTERGGRIHLRVRVMRPVEPPQECNAVVSHMPEVHPDIEENEDKDQFNARGRPIQVKGHRQTGLRPSDRAYGQPGKHKSRQEAVHDRRQDMGQCMAYS